MLFKKLYHSNGKEHLLLNVKILYDKNSQVLSLEIGKGEGVDSDIQGNIVLDYDKKGKIVRINLYDFSFDQFRSKRSVLKKFSRQLLLSPSR